MKILLIVSIVTMFAAFYLLSLSHWMSHPMFIIAGISGFGWLVRASCEFLDRASCKFLDID